MKYFLVLLTVLGWSASLFAQSSLYQRSSQRELDDQAFLYERQLFSATILDNKSLLDLFGPEDQSRRSQLLAAQSALNLDSPDAEGRMLAYMETHADHLSVQWAGIYLGDHYLYRRQFAKAAEAYARVDLTTMNPETQAALYFKRGYVLFEQGKSDEAKGYFDQAKQMGSEYSYDAAYYSGFIALKDNDFERARKDLLNAGQAAYYQGKIPYLLASIYQEEESYATLISYVESSLSSVQNLENKEVLYQLLANAYYEEGNFAKAAENFDRYFQKQSAKNDPENAYKAGFSYFQSENYSKSTEYLKLAATSDSLTGQLASYYLGHAYVKLENIQFANTAFRKAGELDFDPKVQEESIFNFAKTSLQLGAYQEGIQGLEAYLTSYPSGGNFNEAEMLLSEALINTNDYLRALEQMDRMRTKLLRIREAYQKVALYQAMVYYRDKRYDQALTYLDRSLNYPENRDLQLESHFWKGEIFTLKDRLDQAKKSYQAALAMGKTTSSAYLSKSLYGLGYAFFNTKQYPDAAAHFKTYTDRMRSRSNRENYEDAILRLGDCYYVQKKFSQAASVFKQSIRENNPGADYAYYRLGVIENFQSNTQEALANLDQLSNSYPNSRYLEDALYQKGQVLLEALRYREASEAFGSLIRKRPNSPFVPYALEGRAVANYSIQNYAQTVEDYQKILNDYPNSANAETALKGLQEALSLQGRAGEFSDYVKSYKASNPDGGSVQALEFESGKNLYFARDFSQAVGVFSNFIKDYPESAQRSDALYYLGDAYYQLGNVQEALVQFQLLENEPASPQRLKAIRRIGEIQFSQGQYAEAIPYVEQAEQNARTKVEEAEALLRLVEAYERTGKPESVIEAAERLEGLEGIIPETTPKAMLYKAKALLETNQRGPAELTLAILVDEFKTLEGAEGLYLLAKSNQEKGEVQQSNETIFELSGAFSDFDYWYGQLFLLIAENYLLLGEDFQAKATLESIVENTPNAAIRQEAEEKLQTIK